MYRLCMIATIPLATGNKLNCFISASGMLAIVGIVCCCLLFFLCVFFVDFLHVNKSSSQKKKKKIHILPSLLSYWKFHQLQSLIYLLNVRSLVKFYFHLLIAKLIGLQKEYVNNPESGDWNQFDLLVMDQHL